MQLLQLRSPFARAVIPVIGGVVVLVLLAGFTWGMAAFISGGGSEGSSRFAPSTFTVGQVEGLAATVAEEGPLFFPELGTAVGARSIVVDHTGDVPADNWRIYWAYPADRDAACVVEQVRMTRTFTDCEGRIIEVSDLALPDEGVFPRVEDRRTLVLDLRGIAATSTT